LVRIYCVEVMQQTSKASENVNRRLLWSVIPFDVTYVSSSFRLFFRFYLSVCWYSLSLNWLLQLKTSSSRLVNIRFFNFLHVAERVPPICWLNVTFARIYSKCNGSHILHVHIFKYILHTTIFARTTVFQNLMF
jgi:hypothetical protein